MKPHKCPVCDGTGLVSRPPWVPGVGESPNSAVQKMPVYYVKGDIDYSFSVESTRMLEEGLKDAKEGRIFEYYITDIDGTQSENGK